MKITNRNKYNLRDARMAKRDNSARLAAYAELKADISKFYDEFIDGCRWVAMECKKPEYADKFDLYNGIVEQILRAKRNKWEQMINNLEVVSNGKFRRNLWHTWGQLDKAKKLMSVYDSMDTIDVQWLEYLSAEERSTLSNDYHDVWKHYEEDINMHQSYVDSAIKEFGK